MAEEPNEVIRASEIRSQIEQTRSEMTETIDAIEARLSPTRLISDATQSVERSFDVRRIVNTVKANPVPVAMIGFVMAALTMYVLSAKRR